MGKWKSISSAPKDGTVVTVRSVAGLDKSRILYEGPAAWRSEKREALYDPISGECFAEECISMGWKRADSRYSVPGKVMLWWVEI